MGDTFSMFYPIVVTLKMYTHFPYIVIEVVL